MRLIDADKIKYTSIAHLASYPVAPSPCDTVMRAEINAMPTVDAIPRSFIDSICNEKREKRDADIYNSLRWRQRDMELWMIEEVVDRWKAERKEE